MNLDRYCILANMFDRVSKYNLFAVNIKAFFLQIGSDFHIGDRAKQLSFFSSLMHKVYDQSTQFFSKVFGSFQCLVLFVG